MKFGHTFQEALATDEYPPEWVAAAIRYRQLKKCIKKVQKELATLGLCGTTLQQLINNNERKGLISYWFQGNLKEFAPMLVLTIDPEQGIPVDLELQEDTRKALEELVKGGGKIIDVTEVIFDGSPPGSPLGNPHANEHHHANSKDHKNLDDSPEHPDCAGEENSQKSYVEIPLHADVEFFRMLTSELESLDAIQADEEKRLKDQVSALGNMLTAVSMPKRFNPRSDIYAWREIFRIYVESGVFFSTNEASEKVRSADKAEEQLVAFSNKIQTLGLTKSFKNKESSDLLEEFLKINAGLLRLLRFQEINKEAMRKILKKFDKRTHLGARQTFPLLLSSDPFFANTISKALAFTISNQLLPLIPQLDDYLCPICSSISIKPVRLSCSHVFCVRCLVKLQRDRKRYCPLCRGDVVMQANGSNLDIALYNFLLQYFPKETREKQLENEREVREEQFGIVRKNMVERRQQAARDAQELGCSIM